MKRERRVVSLDLDTCSVRLTPLTAQQYYDLFASSVPLADDHAFFMELGRALRQEEFTFAHWYSSLKLMYGESTTLYDDYKCSFGFPFRMQVTREGRSYPYTMDLVDVKGGITYSFRRLLAAGEQWQGPQRHVPRTPIDTEISKADLRNAMVQFSFGVVGFLEGYLEVVKTFDSPFFRSIPAEFGVYGFADGAFFERWLDTQEDYDRVVQELTERGLPHNLVRPNP